MEDSSPGKESREEKKQQDDLVLHPTPRENDSEVGYFKDSKMHPWLHKKLVDLGLEEFYPGKLQKKDVIKIRPSDVGDKSDDRKGFLFIKQLLEVNRDCREIFGANERKIWESGEEPCTYRTAIMLIFACADPFLKRYLVEKMQMCQFAVPFILPLTNEILLWPLRITRSWTSAQSGVKECCLASEPMSMLSVMQVGEFDESVSSQLLNLLFMEPGYSGFSTINDDVPEESIDGLVELAWYLPRGRSTSKEFSEAFVATNLHGNALNNPDQADFLLETSDVAIIISKSIEEIEKLLTHEVESRNKSAKTLQKEKIIVALSMTRAAIKKYSPKQYAYTVIPFVHIENIGPDIRQIKGKLMGFSTTLIHHVQSATHHFKIDEHDLKHQSGMAQAEKIMSYVTNLSMYETRQQILPFQEKWKEWVKLDKEQIRRKNLVSRHLLEQWEEKLETEKQNIHETLEQNGASKCFLDFLSFLERKETQLYFLEWLRLLLNKRSQNVKEEQHSKLSISPTEEDVLLKMKTDFEQSSFGLEHFFREIALYWRFLSRTQLENVSWLPDIMASLLLECYPLEVLDGDASYVPLDWIKQVFLSINRLEENSPKVSVASILGVQSSGKSTFLNTMFGINFAVSSGRCTRGAYLQLVKVDESVKRQMSCDFLAVVDTEGLKSAEQGNYNNEHDNELGTLAVAISDLAIMNIGGENDENMKDVLQIICHAFLRMAASLHRNPSCIMIHQNVGDVAAKQNCTVGKLKFLQILNEMVQVAAEMENLGKRYKKFEDVINYDSDKMNVYIPGLWFGSPPMASVNIDYSEAALKAKQCLLDEIKKKKAHTLLSFVDHLKAVDEAIKQENFIFSFQNTMAAKAYQSLAKCFEKAKWDKTTRLLNWVTTEEPKIKQTGDYRNKTKEEITRKGCAEIEKYIEDLSNLVADYFHEHEEVASLLEKIRSTLEADIVATRINLRNDLNHKIQETFTRLKIEENIETVKKEGERNIMPRLLQLKAKYSIAEENLTIDQKENIGRDFDAMWLSVVGEITPVQTEEINIKFVMEDCLLRHIKDFSHQFERVQWRKYEYKVNVDKDLLLKEYWFGKRAVRYVTRANDKALERAQWETDRILRDCKEYFCNIAESECTFREDLCHKVLVKTSELVHSINNEDFQFTRHYEANILHLVSFFAAEKLSQKQNKYIEQQHPAKKLEKSRERYLDLLLSLVQRGNHGKVFGREIRDGIVEKVHQRFEVILRDSISKDKLELANCKQMQYAMFIDLHKEKSFDWYLEYIHRFRPFALRWIKREVETYLNEAVNDGCSRYVAMMAEEANRILDSFIKILKTNRDSRDYKLFLKSLQDETFEKDVLVDLTDDRIERLGNLPVENFDKYVCDLIQHLEADVKSLIKDKLQEDCISDELKKLNPDIGEQFYKFLMCSDGAQCPFCEAPCTQIGPHEKHKVDMHRPKGLIGCRNKNTDRLCERVCPVDIPTNWKFRNRDTAGEWVPYSEYQTYYPKWHIEDDAHPSTSKYWKMVLMNYNKQFAERRGCLEAEIPESWEAYQWPVVKEDLDALYEITR